MTYTYDPPCFGLTVIFWGDASFQATAAVLMKYLLFWDILSFLAFSLHCLTLEGGTDRLSQKAGH